MNGEGTDAPIGMMDKAYFTSRKDILDFLNEHLQLNLTKIEQTASGAVACQLIENIFPDSIPMHRVNWEAKSAHEFVQNYKLLQGAFNKHRIRKYVDVDKLVRAKYQDNLEFCQWLKAFYDQAHPPNREGYDPVAVRAKGKGGKNLPEYFDVNTRDPTKQLSKRPSVRSLRKTSSPKNKTPLREPVRKRTQSSTSGSSASPIEKDKRSSKTTPPQADGIKQTEAVVLADANLIKRNSELETRNQDLEQTVEQVEKERDFYFGKLRDVELLLQAHEDKNCSDANVLLQRLYKVLYATSEQNVTVDENGEFLEDISNVELLVNDSGTLVPEEMSPLGDSLLT